MYEIHCLYPFFPPIFWNHSFPSEYYKYEETYFPNTNLYEKEY